MPTPIGHALAGLTIAGPSRRATAIACVIAATIADADLLIGSHRIYSHSLGFAILAGAIAALIAKAAGRPSLRIGTLCGLAYASHIVVDWAGKDTADPRGVMALWPLSRTYFIAGVDLFSEVSRRYWKPDEFIWGNLQSVALEVLILGPACVLGWWWRGRRTASQAP